MLNAVIVCEFNRGGACVFPGCPCPRPLRLAATELTRATPAGPALFDAPEGGAAAASMDAGLQSFKRALDTCIVLEKKFLEKASSFPPLFVFPTRVFDWFRLSALYRADGPESAQC